MHASTSVQTPALRSVGNIVTGDDVQTQVIINCGSLPALLSLLSSTKDGIRKEACWTISNVTAGNSTQIQAVIDANIIPPLIHLLQNGDFKTRKEACWAISNATSGGLQKPAQIRYLVQSGCIKPLCDLLACPDNKIIQVALDGLENILKVGEMDKEAGAEGAGEQINRYALFIEEVGGMEKIHECQNNANEEIYMKAYNIIEKYFSDEEGDAENMAETNPPSTRRVTLASALATSSSSSSRTSTSPTAETRWTCEQLEEGSYSLRQFEHTSECSPFAQASRKSCPDS